MGKKERPILITGKSGTGKTTMAKTLVENPIIFYANEIEDRDWKSVTTDVIIEEVHYKPNKDVIMNVIRHCKTKVVLTSNNEKNVPAEVKNSCKLRRAGTVVYSINEIQELAPRSQEPHKIEMSVFDLIGDFLRNTNREQVLENLKFNKPPDVQILTWLGINLHPNKLAFIDGVVKRRWSSDYFYELLTYCHDGRMYSKVSYPSKGNYSKVPNILRRLKLKPNQGYLLPQLLQDEEFEQWAKKRLKSEETRILGIKERVRPRNAPITPDRTLKLEGWY
mgnify:FL=1|jgi:hypothetical protein|tara:strand:- start:5393 stop:6226 length:834 start_codon:yes stop_codon:yes gene_type:complete